MDDRERFALNARFCRRRAAQQKDESAIRHWVKLAEEYEKLATLAGDPAAPARDQRSAAAGS